MTLLRWIQRLTRFGHVPDTLERIEKAGMKALEANCRPLAIASGEAMAVPEGVSGVEARWSGYVEMVDFAALGRIAERTGGRIHLARVPGDFVSRGACLAWSEAGLEEEDREAVRDGFSVARNRTFDHDPRFAMVVLAEVGSRALSSAVNDPGTGIAALEAGQRLAEALLDREPSEAGAAARVVLPPLSLEEMLADLARPIARDGAGTVEVGERIQAMLGALGRLHPEAKPVLRRLSDEALARAAGAGLAEIDHARLDAARRDAGLG